MLYSSFGNLTTHIINIRKTTEFATQSQYECTGKPEDDIS